MVAGRIWKGFWMLCRLHKPDPSASAFESARVAFKQRPYSAKSFAVNLFLRRRRSRSGGRFRIILWQDVRLGSDFVEVWRDIGFSPAKRPIEAPHQQGLESRVRPDIVPMTKIRVEHSTLALHPRPSRRIIIPRVGATLHATSVLD